MRRRGHSRRVTLVTASVMVAAFVGVMAHADPGGAGPGGTTGSGTAGSGNTGSGPVIPGQDAIDHAKATVRDRETAAARIQSALTTAGDALHALEASAGLAAEAYDAAVARAATATRAAADAQAEATAALDTQHRAEGRLGAFAAEMYRQGPDMARIVALLHADTLHDFAARQQALANYDAAGALAVEGARLATRDATTARQQAERAALDQRAAEARARAARDHAQALAVAEQAQIAGIKARQDALLGQLAAAQGIEVGLERQRQAGLAEAAARAAAERAEAAERAAAATRAAAAARAAAEARAEAERRDVAVAAAAAAAQRAAGQRAAGQRAAGQPQTHRPQESGSPAAPGAGTTAQVQSHNLTAPPNADGAVRTMLNYIYAQLGKPYVWGGAGPDAFDCSGLAMRGLEAAGWSFPHPAQWQYLAMHPVSYSELRPGDLVFWAEDGSDPHTIYHEAIFIGNDRVIQAPRPGGVVEQQSLWVNGPPSFYARP